MRIKPKDIYSLLTLLIIGPVIAILAGFAATFVALKEICLDCKNIFVDIWRN